MLVEPDLLQALVQPLTARTTHMARLIVLAQREITEAGLLLVSQLAGYKFNALNQLKYGKLH